MHGDTHSVQLLAVAFTIKDMKGLTMHNDSRPIDVGPAGGPQCREALGRLTQIVLDGLQHGYFRCSISGGIGNAKKRELVIEAGKSHKFTIPEEELPR